MDSKEGSSDRITDAQDKNVNIHHGKKVMQFAQLTLCQTRAGRGK